MKQFFKNSISIRKIKLYFKKNKRIKNNGLNNKIILIKENNQIQELKRITGLKVNINGNNNVIKIHEPYAFENCHLTINGDNHLFEVQKITNPVFSIRNTSFIMRLGNNNSIKIGKNLSMVGGYIQAEDNNTFITIGDECMFSAEILVRTSDGHAILDNQTHEVINSGKNITIGNHVWLSFKTTVLKGSKIGDDSIVATGAIVTKDYFNQKNVILAGIPAKVVKENINWNWQSIQDYERYKNGTA